METAVSTDLGFKETGPVQGSLHRESGVWPECANTNSSKLDKRSKDSLSKEKSTYKSGEA